MMTICRQMLVAVVVLPTAVAAQSAPLTKRVTVKAGSVYCLSADG
jgi:hypothetical protein